jgi:hypothetical protein
MSAETAMYTVLAATIAAAGEDEALFESELHQTLYERITKPFGVRVGDAHFDLSPGPGGPVDEFDLISKVQIFARPSDAENPQAQIDAREKVRAMTIAVAEVLTVDPTLSGAINDCRILGAHRGWANVQGVRHAVAELVWIANETGQVN